MPASQIIHYGRWKRSTSTESKTTTAAPHTGDSEKQVFVIVVLVPIFGWRAQTYAWIISLCLYNVGNWFIKPLLVCSARASIVALGVFACVLFALVLVTACSCILDLRVGQTASLCVCACLHGAMSVNIHRHTRRRTWIGSCCFKEPTKWPAHSNRIHTHSKEQNTTYRAAADESAHTKTSQMK